MRKQELAKLDELIKDRGVYYYRYSGSIPLFQMGYYPSCCLSC